MKLGREAIVSDLELTDDHEEVTEEHPGASELDRIVGGAQDTSCVCARSFPGDGRHIMWHARRCLKTSKT